MTASKHYTTSHHRGRRGGLKNSWGPRGTSHYMGYVHGQLGGNGYIRGSKTISTQLRHTAS
jgi:hypothetical protein